jgi:hypothetical protein
VAIHIEISYGNKFTLIFARSFNPAWVIKLISFWIWCYIFCIVIRTMHIHFPVMIIRENNKEPEINGQNS